MNITHTSYSEAMKALEAYKAQKNSILVTWDAGNGWTGKGYWCNRRRRIITSVAQGGHELF